MGLPKALAGESGNLGLACKQHDLQLDSDPRAVVVADISGNLPSFAVAPIGPKDRQDLMAEVPVGEVR